MSWPAPARVEESRPRGGGDPPLPLPPDAQPPAQAGGSGGDELQLILLWATQPGRGSRGDPACADRVEGDRDRTGGGRDGGGAGGQSAHALLPDPAPARPDGALPTSSLALPLTPPALPSPHHRGWATVKRRCRRMLWFTRSFLKSPGELRGESRGEPGPGAGAGAGVPCIAATAWRQDGAWAVAPFLDSRGGGAVDRGQRAHRPASPRVRSG